MDMMTDIAAMAMNMKSAQLQQNYSVAVAEKAMDLQRSAAAEMAQLMPEVPQIPKGEYIDVYA